ncbi:MAG TPA: molybdopterin cofactor-binding domain-containing protein, partial [Planctomycetaceae bacterium]|nr:molybdopterin cofactor-binding domain-containing protein [Planctomycetaceae bacterium]
IQIEFEPLPFNVDPIETLRPGTPTARTQGNVWMRVPVPGNAAGGGAPAPAAGGQGAAATRPAPTRPEIRPHKWTDADFAAAAGGQLPMGEAPDTSLQWSYGDVEAGFRDAALVLDETFSTAANANLPLESRSAMAYWQNGKLYLHGSTQSTAQTVPAVARWAGVDPGQVVVISEYTGGGFGSKVAGSITMAIPALLAKKTNAPVMMRINQEEEHYIGRVRPAFHGRVKIGFAKDGRITALDLYWIADNGPYEQQHDCGTGARMASLIYQPPAMNFRGMSVVTNTNPTGSQTQPGGMNAVAIIEPVLSKAARLLGIDQVAMRRVNAPEGQAPVGPANQTGIRPTVTSAFVKEALDRGAELFGWEERKGRSRQRQGSKVRGVGVAVSTYIAGSAGFDGLFVVRPDGRLAIQSGIGNLGTHSVIDVHRVVAEVLDVPWEKCDITWGNTAKHLPWTCISGGSQTIHAMTRAAHAAAMDARTKLQEIAARTLGGAPADYDVANERVFRRDGGRGLSLAEAARRAIELGGKYDGHEVPEDVNAFTKASAAALAGQGLMGVARDNYPRTGQTHSYVASFAEVDVDIETGQYVITDFLAVADVGTIIHPRSLGGQILGRSMLGISHTIGQKVVFDQHYGVALATRFHQNRPPSILDTPRRMAWDALNIPDPGSPVDHSRTRLTCFSSTGAFSYPSRASVPAASSTAIGAANDILPSPRPEPFRRSSIAVNAEEPAAVPPPAAFHGVRVQLPSGRSVRRTTRSPPSDSTIRCA